MCSTQNLDCEVMLQVAHVCVRVSWCLSACLFVRPVSLSVGVGGRGVGVCVGVVWVCVGVVWVCVGVGVGVGVGGGVGGGG